MNTMRGVLIPAVLAAACGVHAADAAPRDARDPGDPRRRRPEPREEHAVMTVQGAEKDSRTPAQQKINSQVLYEIYRRQGKAAEKNIPSEKTRVKIDQKGRALVDLRAEVTPALLEKLTSFDSQVTSTSIDYRSIVAWVPLLKLEELAGDPAVRAIEMAAEATTAR